LLVRLELERQVLVRQAPELELELVRLELERA
jgi:hypothetical protein